MLGVDGISEFDALHSRQHDEEVQLYAFDCLAYNGDDLTRLPLHLRKTNLEQLLRGRSDGIFAGRCDHWLKVKNRKHPAFSHVADQF